MELASILTATVSILLLRFWAIIDGLGVNQHLKWYLLQDNKLSKQGRFRLANKVIFNQYLCLSAISQKRINKNDFAVSRCDIYVNNVLAGYQHGDLTLVSHVEIACWPSFVYLFTLFNYQIFYSRQISYKSQILWFLPKFGGKVVRSGQAFLSEFLFYSNP